ncbi:hypothetical protein TNCT_552341 [Trichonephila clavata]|uniref:Uncharacterized protein n=1 Tax=Trichonephila clavata TaxID=2740835 RepID=A0A8X6HIK3_TRICU|nr:hypothetical protein TNCT_552341 [Trichonephila clavata]
MDQVKTIAEMSNDAGKLLVDYHSGRSTKTEYGRHGAATFRIVNVVHLGSLDVQLRITGPMLKVIIVNSMIRFPFLFILPLNQFCLKTNLVYSFNVKPLSWTSPLGPFLDQHDVQKVCHCRTNLGPVPSNIKRRASIIKPIVGLFQTRSLRGKQILPVIEERLGSNNKWNTADLIYAKELRRLYGRTQRKPILLLSNNFKIYGAFQPLLGSPGYQKRRWTETLLNKFSDLKPLETGELDKIFGNSKCVSMFKGKGRSNRAASGGKYCSRWRSYACHAGMNQMLIRIAAPAHIGIRKFKT